MEQNEKKAPVFDEFQREVINLSSGYNLVLAPPGCGKTAILAERVKTAVNQGVCPENMLCLTFTNRAARNMRSRMECDDSAKVFIGNVHRYCSKFLFENELVPMTTAILDETDIFSIIQELCDSDVTEPTYQQRATYMGYVNLQHLLLQYRLGHDNSVILNPECVNFSHLRALCNVLNLEYTRENILRIYDCIHSPEDISQLLKNQCFTYTDLLEQFLFAHKYEDYKNENSLIDFDDILILQYDYLIKNEGYKRYSWVQIDEVQDLNSLQLAIVDCITDNNAVTIYLGDEQQSIFSFIGADSSTLSMLRERCGTNIYHLHRNYRSPKYLLDVFNTYAINVLGVPGDLLPESQGDEVAKPGDLILKYSHDNEAAVNDMLALINDIKEEGKTAIIVPTNADADAFAEAAKDLPHFKISGTDFFSTEQIKLALNHLNVLACDTNFMAWARIFRGIGLTKNMAQSRRTVSVLKDCAVCPSDFLSYKDSSYILEFAKAYDTTECVIFDTETSGLNVFDDDIIQLAAIKVKDGKITGKYNVIMHTEQQIPAMLGDIPNPIVEEYAKADLCDRMSGLKGFLDFAEGCVLIGHNVEFDWHILDFNLRKYCGISNLKELHSEYFDTLKLARLLLPETKSFKLKNLLALLHLEGENSHMADDDIVATKSLADELLSRISRQDFKDKHCRMLRRTEAFREKFKTIYGALYLNAIDSLYHRGKPYAIATEILNVKNALLKDSLSEAMNKKMEYFIKLLMLKVDESQEIDQMSSLYEQNICLNPDLNTFKEADLCDTELITENLYISTVHKAKGLEFDNVIVFGAVDGTYPHFASQKQHEKDEDARVLYVALSRAKRRLILSAYDYYKKTTGGGTKLFEKGLSPFIKPLKSYFTTHNYYYPGKRYPAVPQDDESRAEESQEPYYSDRGL